MDYYAQKSRYAYSSLKETPLLRTQRDDFELHTYASRNNVWNYNFDGDSSFSDQYRRMKYNDHRTNSSWSYRSDSKPVEANLPCIDDSNYGYVEDFDANNQYQPERHYSQNANNQYQLERHYSQNANKRHKWYQYADFYQSTYEQCSGNSQSNYDYEEARYQNYEQSRTEVRYPMSRERNYQQNRVHCNELLITCYGDDRSCSTNEARFSKSSCQSSVKSRNARKAVPEERKSAKLHSKHNRKRHRKHGNYSVSTEPLSTDNESDLKLSSRDFVTIDACGSPNSTSESTEINKINCDMSLGVGVSEDIVPEVSDVLVKKQGSSEELEITETGLQTAVNLSTSDLDNRGNVSLGSTQVHTPLSSVLDNLIKKERIKVEINASDKTQVTHLDKCIEITKDEVLKPNCVQGELIFLFKFKN